MLLLHGINNEYCVWGFYFQCRFSEKFSMMMAPGEEPRFNHAGAHVHSYQCLHGPGGQTGCGWARMLPLQRVDLSSRSGRRSEY